MIRLLVFVLLGAVLFHYDIAQPILRFIGHACFYLASL